MSIFSTKWIVPCVALAVFPAAALAATFPVTKTADTDDGVCDADCSLREAVAAAVLAAGDDVVMFANDVFSSPQTITLGGSEIVITNSGRLDIEGPGTALLTISGANASRIFSNNTATTTISDIRFTEGNGVGAANTGRAGAIFNNGGDLTLRRVILTGNSAANGGALNNSASGSVLTIEDSTISNNTSSGSGGSLQNFSMSTLNVIGSTFEDNTSNGTTGGGAAQLNGIATIINSTFSGNRAPSGSGGAITSNGTSLQLINVTMTGNVALTSGGALHRASSTPNVFVRNTVIAGNTGVAESPDVTTITSLTSLGNNLIGIVGTSLGWVASDLLDQPALLGSLADNGGPTETHELLPGSPAIDAGDDCVIDQSCTSNNVDFDIDFDQRGESRPRGAAVDIGAVESAGDLIFADGFD